MRHFKSPFMREESFLVNILLNHWPVYHTLISQRNCSWSHFESGFETQASMTSINKKWHIAFLHHKYYKQRGKNKYSFEKQPELTSSWSEACRMPARKNEEGWSVCSRSDSFVDDFGADPFDENASELSYVQSVVIASRELLEDVQNVLEKWEKQSNDIL